MTRFMGGFIFSCHPERALCPFTGGAPPFRDRVYEDLTGAVETPAWVALSGTRTQPVRSLHRSPVLPLDHPGHQHVEFYTWNTMVSVIVTFDLKFRSKRSCQIFKIKILK